jgi:hypothetical protein
MAAIVKGFKFEEIYTGGVSHGGGAFWYAPGWPRSYWFGLTMDF